MMKDHARRLGFSDTAAAEGVGVSSSTISRWKKENPEIAHELQAARQECRIHHLERIMQFAEGDNNLGLRASMWLLERLFPGDYAPRMSERFACRNFEDRAREREEEALQREREAEAKAERAAEAQAKYLEMMAAYEAEIAQHAAAAPRTESEPPAGPAPVAAEVLPRVVEREDAASASESDSHNSRNSDAMERDRGPHTPCAASPDRTEDCADHGEPLNERRPPTVRSGSLNEAAPANDLCAASVSHSHNSRNSDAVERDRGPHTPGTASPDRTEDCADHGEPLNEQRPPTVRSGSLNEAAPANDLCAASVSHSHNSRNAPETEQPLVAPASFTASESDSHNSRNSPPSLTPAATHAGGSLIF